MNNDAAAMHSEKLFDFIDAHPTGHSEMRKACMAELRRRGFQWWQILANA